MSKTELAVLPSYLRAVRRELLDATSVEDDPYKQIRAERLAEALTFLLSSIENNAAESPSPETELVKLANDVDVFLSTYSAGYISSEGTARQRLDTSLVVLAVLKELSDTDEKQRKSFIERARKIEAKRLKTEANKVEIARSEIDPGHVEALKELPPLTEKDITEFICAQSPKSSNIRIENFSRPSGVFSKEIYKFDIIENNESTVPAILRRDRSFEIVPTSASLEFELLNELHDRGLPVAKCIAAQYDDASPINGPCLLMERLDGISLALSGENAATKEVILQLAELLARLHTTPIEGLPIPRQSSSGSCREQFLSIVHEYHERLHEYQRTPHLILDAAFAWLYANADLIDNTLTLVHADYDLRNVLFDGEKINAVLDFELSHLGHPGEDLAYLKKDIEELIPWSEFMAVYEANGGSNCSEELIQYFMVWSYAFQGTCNVTAFTGFQNGIHNDVFLGTLPFIEFQHIQTRIVELIA